MDDAQRDELIVRIDERVSAIQGTLEVGDRRLNDHSKRIGFLERWRAGLVAAVGTILAILALVSRFI